MCLLSLDLVKFWRVQYVVHKKENGPTLLCLRIDRKARKIFSWEFSNWKFGSVISSVDSFTMRDQSSEILTWSFLVWSLCVGFQTVMIVLSIEELCISVCVCVSVQACLLHEVDDRRRFHLSIRSKSTCICRCALGKNGTLAKPIEVAN